MVLKSTRKKPYKLKFDAPVLTGGKKLPPPVGYKPKKSHGVATSFTSTRRAVHRGKKISVRTTYRIEIDGEPLKVHTMVMDDGTVHCHGLPNYSFTSAVDLARSVIDASRLAYVDRDDLPSCGPGHKKPKTAAKKTTKSGGHH